MKLTPPLSLVQTRHNLLGYMAGYGDDTGDQILQERKGQQQKEDPLEEKGQHQDQDPLEKQSSSRKKETQKMKQQQR